MKLSAFFFGAGIGCVLGSVAFTGYALANLAFGDEPELSPAQCRDEAERAIMLREFDGHTHRLAQVRNAYARQNGATER